MNMNNISLVTAAVAALTSGVAQASVVSLSSITATWYEGNPAANVSYNNNGTPAPEARWGTGGAGGVQSGYDFVVADQPIEFTVPPSPSPDQVLGTFTHQNFPISAGTSITDIKLGITADVSIDSVFQTNVSFNYGFDHWETPNTPQSGENCADGGDNGTGVNINGCADRVIADWLSTSEDFEIGTDTYTLNVIGFSTDSAGTSPFTSFWTAEGQENVAYLVGNVALRSDVEPGPGPGPGLPEPSSIALLGIGVLGGVFSYRRRKQADANE